MGSCVKSKGCPSVVKNTLPGRPLWASAVLVQATGLVIGTGQLLSMAGLQRFAEQQALAVATQVIASALDVIEPGMRGRASRREESDGP